MVSLCVWGVCVCVCVWVFMQKLTGIWIASSTQGYVPSFSIPHACLWAVRLFVCCMHSPFVSLSFWASVHANVCLSVSCLSAFSSPDNCLSVCLHDCFSLSYNVCMPVGLLSYTSVLRYLTFFCLPDILFEYAQLPIVQLSLCLPLHAWRLSACLIDFPALTIQYMCQRHVVIVRHTLSPAGMSLTSLVSDIQAGTGRDKR
jgi:hypothetical protein